MTNIGIYAIIGFLLLLTSFVVGCYYWGWRLQQQGIRQAKMKKSEAMRNIQRWHGNYAKFINTMKVIRSYS